MRFERGVDPAHQGRAVERATALLLEIAGGRPGPLTRGGQRNLPARPSLGALRRARLAQLLGVDIPDQVVSESCADSTCAWKPTDVWLGRQRAAVTL